MFTSPTESEAATLHEMPAPYARFWRPRAERRHHPERVPLAERRRADSRVLADLPALPEQELLRRLREAGL